MADTINDKDKINAPTLQQQLAKNGFAADPNAAPIADPNNPIPIVTEEPKAPVIDWEARAKELEAKVSDLENNPKIVEKVVTITPEDLKAQEEAEEKEVLNYVVLDKKLSPSDYENYKKSINIPARDYVYENYKATIQAENPEISDSEIQIDFDNEYSLSSANEGVLKRANARLEREAKILKDEQFKAFHGIKEEYKTVKTNKARVATYSEALNSTKPEISVSIKLDDLDEAIEIPVDYADILPELHKDLQEAVFIHEFTKEGVDTKKSITDYITSEVKSRKYNEIVKNAVEKAYEAKMKKIKLGSVAPPEKTSGSKQETVVSDPQFNFIAKEVEKNKIR